MYLSVCKRWFRLVSVIASVLRLSSEALGTRTARTARRASGAAHHRPSPDACRTRTQAAANPCPRPLPAQPPAVHGRPAARPGLQPRACFACSTRPPGMPVACGGASMPMPHHGMPDGRSLPPRCTAATGRPASTQTRARLRAGCPSIRTTSCSRTTWAACARDPRTCEPSKSRRLVRPSHDPSAHDDPSPGDRALMFFYSCVK